LKNPVGLTSRAWHAQNMALKLFRGAGGAGGAGGGEPLEDRFNKLLAMIGGGDAGWTPDDKEMGLRDMIYGQADSAYGDNTDFTKTAYGRLAAAQTAEGTNAGIRQFRARTGGSNSAASAATEALLRRRGGTDLARVGLEARDRMQGRVGDLLRYLSGSLDREAQSKRDRFGARSDLLGTLLNADLQREQIGAQSRLGAVNALGGQVQSMRVGGGGGGPSLMDRRRAIRDERWEKQKADSRRRFALKWGA
jgi:hypothetical protein